MAKLKNYKLHMMVIHLLLRSQTRVNIVFALCRKNQHRSCYIKIITIFEIFVTLVSTVVYRFTRSPSLSSVAHLSC